MAHCGVQRKEVRWLIHTLRTSDGFGLQDRRPPVGHLRQRSSWPLPLWLPTLRGLSAPGSQVGSPKTILSSLLLRFLIELDVFIECTEDLLFLELVWWFGGRATERLFFTGLSKVMM